MEGQEGYSLQVGALEVLPVLDAVVLGQPSTTWAGQPGDDHWGPHEYLLDDEGRIGAAMGGFLIRHANNDRLMLVDLGLGMQKGFNIVGEHLLESLAAYGYAPEDITDVVF